MLHPHFHAAPSCTVPVKLRAPFLQAATGFLAGMGLSFQIVARPYTPALQDIQMMLTLDHSSIPPLDWVIVADTDELYTYGFTTIAEAIVKMEAEGATYALGEMLDHVARNGSLAMLDVSQIRSDNPSQELKIMPVHCLFPAHLPSCQA